MKTRASANAKDSEPLPPMVPSPFRSRMDVAGEITESPAGHGRLVVGSVALSFAAMLALAALQYRMPDDFRNLAGPSQLGVSQYALGLFRAGPSHLGSTTFVWIFRGLLLLAWAGYLAALVAAFRGQYRPGRWLVPAVVGACVVIAVVFPPSLSSDVYAYVGYGRMVALYGWNPYVSTLSELAATGDGAALVAPLPFASTYPPGWTMCSAALVAVLSHSSLAIQVLAFKLLAGLAVAATAVLGGRIARRLDTQRAGVAVIAIGLNPLMLVEGPGNGHNDALMVALLLAAFLLLAREKRVTPFLVLGLSVAVKFVTAAAAPWFALVSFRERRTLASAGFAVGVMVLVLAPAVLGYLPFGLNAASARGIAGVYDRQTARPQASLGVGGTSGGVGTRPETVTAGTAFLLACGLAALLLRTGGRRRLWVALLVAAVGSLLARNASPSLGLLVGIAAFMAATAVMITSREFGLSLVAWSAFSLVFALAAMPLTFAWYAMWPLSVSLCRWDSVGRQVSAVCLGWASVILLMYTVRA